MKDLAPPLDDDDGIPLLTDVVEVPGPAAGSNGDVVDDADGDGGARDGADRDVVDRDVVDRDVVDRDVVDRDSGIGPGAEMRPEVFSSSLPESAPVANGLGAEAFAELLKREVLDGLRSTEPGLETALMDHLRPVVERATRRFAADLVTQLREALDYAADSLVERAVADALAAHANRSASRPDSQGSTVPVDASRRGASGTPGEA